MKTLPISLCVLTAVLLFGSTTLVSAQNAAQRAMMRSPAMKRASEHSYRQTMLSNWDTRMDLTAIGLLRTDGNAEALGITEEQRREIMDMLTKITVSSNDPDLGPILEEMRPLYAMPGGPFAEDASEETQMKYVELQTRMSEILQARRNEAINAILTPDQFRKIQEYQIASMTGNPFVTPDMFEALDLSGDQKRQLEEIKRELKPEYEKTVDKWVASQLAYQDKIQDEIGDKLDGVTDPGEHQRIHTEASRKVQEKYPDILQGMQEFNESGRVLSDKLKFNMFDVLTDEQMERMTQLIENPPEHVKKIRENFRIAYENHSKAAGNAASPVAGEPAEWRPGPDSWKPSEAIPEKYLQHREEQKARFPRRQ